MTKLIWAFIIIVVIFCGWHLFQYWESVANEEQTRKKEAAAVVDPNYLPGLPPQLNQSYQHTLQQGNLAMRAWLKTYSPSLQDPRKAWIELDFAVAITREDPAEARRIFKAVKDRTPPNSPIQPRLKQLEKSYE
jgi:hypothetical protein